MAIEVKRTFDILEFCLSELPRKDALGGKNSNDWYVYSTAEYVEKSHQFAIGLMALGLKKGDKVALVGFGTFSVAKRAARTGRNPQTGKAIKIAAKKVAKFSVGAELKKIVNK